MRADQLDILKALAAEPAGLNTVQLAEATGREHFSARRGAASLAKLGLLKQTSTVARQSRLAWHWSITDTGFWAMEAKVKSLAPTESEEKIVASPALKSINSVFNWR